VTKLLLSIHVLVAIIAIGPVTVAASMFPAATRRASAEPTDPRGVAVLHNLHRICRVYATLGVLVPVFGLATASSLGVLGDAWLIISIILTAAAAAMLIFLVLPGQAAVLRSLPASPPVTAPSSQSGTAPAPQSVTAPASPAATAAASALTSPAATAPASAPASPVVTAAAFAPTSPATTAPTSAPASPAATAPTSAPASPAAISPALSAPASPPGDTVGPARQSAGEANGRRLAARLGMVTGIFNLLWAVVVVLMIVRPGSTTGV
jgi:hypothetical protein